VSCRVDSIAAYMIAVAFFHWNFLLFLSLKTIKKISMGKFKKRKKCALGRKSSQLGTQ